MVWSIFFSNLFENDTDQFLFGNFDKLPRSIALFLSQNFTKISSSLLKTMHGLFIVYTTTITTF